MNRLSMLSWAGNSGCGTDSRIYPVYLEYIIGETSYLLTTLRYRVHHNGVRANYLCITFHFYRTTSSPDLYTVWLPLLAQAEGVQFSWTQANGFQANEAVWQLDNVAVLFANQIDSPLLDTFTRPASSSLALFYSSGTIEVKITHDRILHNACTCIIQTCVQSYHK